MSKIKARNTSDREFADPDRGPLFSPRFIIALLLIALGIAWIAYYYLGVRPPEPVIGADGQLSNPEPGGPGFMGDLGKWNYLIGFGLAMLGLVVAAHPSTPLGRGRGVVVGMLFCFIFGLLWICTFYLFAEKLHEVPVMNDLGNYNLAVGVALMAVGFTYATKWE